MARTNMVMEFVHSVGKNNRLIDLNVAFFFPCFAKTDVAHVATLSPQQTRSYMGPRSLQKCTARTVPYFAESWRWENDELDPVCSKVLVLAVFNMLSRFKWVKSVGHRLDPKKKRHAKAVHEAHQWIIQAERSTKQVDPQIFSDSEHRTDGYGSKKWLILSYFIYQFGSTILYTWCYLILQSDGYGFAFFFFSLLQLPPKQLLEADGGTTRKLWTTS